MNRKIIHDFFERGLSMIGIARKYGLTNLKVQEIVRRYMKRNRR